MGVQLGLLFEALSAVLSRALVVGAVDAGQVATETGQAEQLGRAAQVAVVLRRGVLLRAGWSGDTTNLKVQKKSVKKINEEREASFSIRTFGDGCAWEFAAPFSPASESFFVWCVLM